jgi:hypothetical protein
MMGFGALWDKSDEGRLDKRLETVACPIYIIHILVMRTAKLIKYNPAEVMINDFSPFSHVIS